MEAFKNLPRVTKIRGEDVWRLHPKGNLPAVPPVILRQTSASVYFNYGSRYNREEDAFLPDGTLLYRESTSPKVNGDLEKLLGLDDVVLYARLPEGYFRAPVRVNRHAAGFILRVI